MAPEQRQQQDRDHRALPVLCVLVLLLSACTEDPVPKPRGWPRLDLPEKSYRDWTAEGAFSASIPTYCEPLERTGNAAARWFNLRFPGQKATVHLTYRRITNDLDTLIHDAHDIKGKHRVMASRIRNERMLRDSARVFGTLFDVEGNVASPMLFYLTDSTTHFLYGALYFDARPNADSLAPVTTRLREDLRTFAGTLRWE